MYFSIRQMIAEDWDAVRKIYCEGIATTNATFETEPPTWISWDNSHLPTPRLVAINSEGRLCGWGALSLVSSRCVYAGVAEVSVYVGENCRGQGVGKTLVAELIRLAEHQGIWTLQAGIFPENISSIALHQSLGFRLVGRRERIGKLHGKWRDTLLLERRSNSIGVE